MKSYLCGLVLLALTTVAFGIPLQTKEVKADVVDDFRLPETVLPWNYQISLRPYLLASDGSKQFTFDGEVFIRVNTSEAAIKTIVLHSKSLTYTKSELYQTQTPTNVVVITSNTTNSTTDKLTLNLATPLTVGVNYTLHFVYTGLMEDDMHGFYKSYYIDEKNNTKWLGSTQFETNHARRAFPSFDEPSFKATFDVTITQHKSFTTVSNTRVTSSAVVDTDYVKTTFQTTPIMSTYLLAFLVSDFKERTSGSFAVTAREEFYDQTEYGVTVGEKLLAEFDKYTNLRYYDLGVDKMHMAAIPDFSAGAMENWGLLTYRERSLLYDKTSTALSAKQAIAAVISHEQAHMWFGDLVTCNWWSYTWLNEGFARYFQYFTTHAVEPSFQLDAQFTVDQVQSIMLKDSTSDTNPMTDPNVSTPSDLSRMFNQISYNKGASVIRMVKHAMGETKFQASLQSYLKENSYTSTRPEHLLKHWKLNWPAETANEAEGVFNTFTTQVGYPVIYLDIASDFSKMTITQKRFLLNPEDGSDRNLLYVVPFTYTSNTENNFVNTVPKMYLPASTAGVTVQLPTNTTWVMGNIQQTGYYRVNYTVMAWHRIHHTLMTDNWGGIHETNRAQFVDDLLNLARGSVIDYDLALGCLGYIEGETHYLPWTSAFNGLNYLSIRLGEDTENFGNYITQLTKKVYTALGFEERSSDTTMQIYTRSKLISWLCRYGHEECIKNSLKLFRAMKTTPVPVNIRGSVYCSALRDGTADDFKALYEKFKAERVPTEQTLIINNLGCIRDEKLVKEYFDIIVSDEIRRQDKSTALSSLYTSNNENVSPVFNLVINNFEALANSMGSNSSVASVISGIASRFTTEEQKKQLEDFIKKDGDKIGSAVSTLNEAVKAVEQNLAWSKKKLGSIKLFLEGYKTGGANAVGVSILTIVFVTIVSIVLH